MTVKNIIRWETDCCGFLFNTSGVGEIPDKNEPTTIKVHGVGSYLVGDCPGCNEEHPSISKISE